MPYRIYLYILTQMISTGKAEVFFDGKSVEITLDSKTGKWLISSSISSPKNQNRQIFKEFFPTSCKARFTSKSGYLFLGENKILSFRQEFSYGNRYAIFREMFSSYLKEAEDWRTIFSS